MARKTIAVTDLLNMHHKLTLAIHGAFGLEYSEAEKAAALATVCQMTEQVLMETGNYKGFGWVDENGTAVSHCVAAHINSHSPGSVYYSRRYYRAA